MGPRGRVQRSSIRSPASVGATLRVVRVRRADPHARLEAVDGVAQRRLRGAKHAAARVKLRSSSDGHKRVQVEQLLATH